MFLCYLVSHLKQLVHPSTRPPVNLPCYPVSLIPCLPIPRPLSPSHFLLSSHNNPTTLSVSISGGLMSSTDRNVKTSILKPLTLMFDILSLAFCAPCPKLKVLRTTLVILSFVSLSHPAEASVALADSLRHTSSIAVADSLGVRQTHVPWATRQLRSDRRVRR